MNAEPSREQLPRTLGLWSSVGLVVGITIGTGIFRTPARIASLVPDPLLVLGLWVAGGVVTLCGALSIAELAAALPQTGGFYAYLREGWGRLAGFLFGWSELVLIRATALGGMAIVFGEYLLRSIGLDPAAHTTAARLVPAAAILFAAAVNIRGANLGALIVGVSTLAKFAALVLLVGAAAVLGGGQGASLANLTTGTGSSIGISSLGLALISVFWAYDGWGDLSFAAGEVRNPQRNLPRAIILGTLAIVIIYVLVNVAYLYVIPIETVGRSPLIAADMMLTLFGRTGAALVSVFVMISSFSSLNGSMLAAPRVFFAMAEDGLLFGRIASVHSRFRTPWAAIALSAILGIALVLSQGFERLASTFVLAIWPFYALSVAAIYRLRRTRPTMPRPYRVVGYPVVPAIFIGAVVWFIGNALINEPRPTLVTFALILAGVPVYAVFFRRRVDIR
jgi:amino acid transporter